MQDHFFKSGLAEKIMSDSEGMLVASFGDISPNPDVTEVDACADIIRKNNIEFVVVVGGGSPMDCAKAAASVALTNDSIRKYPGTWIKYRAITIYSARSSRPFRYLSIPSVRSPSHKKS